MSGWDPFDFKDPKRLASSEQRKTIRKNQNGRCNHCGKLLRKDNMQIDHMYAHSHGGPTNYANLQGLCKTCHKKRTAAQARDRSEFKRFGGF
jgi:5-methylcytosine-specific restriction endonuclease McrA